MKKKKLRTASLKQNLLVLIKKECTRSFLNDHIKITVYFTKNDDLIHCQFNMKMTRSTFFLTKLRRFLLELPDTILS